MRPSSRVARPTGSRAAPERDRPSGGRRRKTRQWGRASAWARLVLAPVANVVSRLRVLVLAAFRILHGRRLQIRGFISMMYREQEPFTNAGQRCGWRGRAAL
jgi:hypothetical protein